MPLSWPLKIKIHAPSAGSTADICLGLPGLGELVDQNVEQKAVLEIESSYRPVLDP